MIRETLVVGSMMVNCYIVGSEKGGEAAVIDPGDSGQEILAVLKKKSLALKYIILTHAHFDHLGAARELQEKTGAKVLLNEKDEILLKNIDSQSSLFGMPAVPHPAGHEFVKEGDVLHVGGLRLGIIETPGHSPGGISIYLEKEGIVFTGDTLFWGSVGRTDLPGSDHGALIDSLRKKLACLPDGTKVYPGHFDDTSIGFEKEQNPFFE